MEARAEAQLRMLQPEISFTNVIGDAVFDPLQRREQDFVSKCVHVVNVPDQHSLPLAAIMNVCDKTDVVVECKARWRESLLNTFEGSKDYQKWCHGFYGWFMVKLGQLCPTQCGAHACAPHCDFAKQISHLLVEARRLESLQLNVAKEKKLIAQDSSLLSVLSSRVSNLGQKATQRRTEVELKSRDLQQAQRVLNGLKSRSRTSMQTAKSTALALRKLHKQLAAATAQLQKARFQLDATGLELEDRKDAMQVTTEKEEVEALQSQIMQLQEKVKTLKVSVAEQEKAVTGIRHSARLKREAMKTQRVTAQTANKAAEVQDVKVVKLRNKLRMAKRRASAVQHKLSDTVGEQDKMRKVLNAATKLYDKNVVQLSKNVESLAASFELARDAKASATSFDDADFGVLQNLEVELRHESRKLLRSMRKERQ